MLPDAAFPAAADEPPLPDPAAHLALRARAEERRRLTTEATNGKSPEDLQRLVEELQVHQIELEMQHEELLLAEAEAQAARAGYEDLYDLAPVGYFSLSALGLVQHLNLRAEQLLGTGRARLLDRRFALFVAPAERLAFGQFLARLLVAPAPAALSCELTLLRDDGSSFVAQLEGMQVAGPLVGPSTGPQCRLAVLDVSARHRATAALAASETRFRRLFADSNDAVVLLQVGRYVDCNAAALRLLGARRRDDVVGHAPAEFAPPAQPDGRSSAALLDQMVAEALRRGSQRREVLMRRRTGADVWVEAVLTPIGDAGAEPLVHVLWRDVTERNRLAGEATRQLLRQQQQVLAAVLSTQETERKRIAETLHNSLGQLLYATRLSLEDPAAAPAGARALGLLNEAIHAARTLAFELTPGILEDFGLPTALDALVKRLVPAGLPVRLHLADLAERLPLPLELSVYRIVQELLNNAMKHAGATEVIVHVAREAGRLEVSVEDNGRGFDAAALAAQPLVGIGLAGVRNRVALLGGTLALNAQVGRGTIVSIEVPVDGGG